MIVNNIIAFTTSPMGEIIIRVVCVLFIGAIGLKLFIKKIFDIFELYARSAKSKKALDLLSEVVSIIGTVGISMIVSHVYAHINDGTMKEIYINAQGLFYGLGAVGLSWLFADGRLIKFVRVWRGKSGKK